MSGPFEVDDLIGVDHLGRQFLATVREPSPTEKLSSQELPITPVPANVTYYVIQKREVKSHYKLRGRSSRPRYGRNGGLAYG